MLCLTVGTAREGEWLAGVISFRDIEITIFSQSPKATAHAKAKDGSPGNLHQLAPVRLERGGTLWNMYMEPEEKEISSLTFAFPEWPIGTYTD